MRAESRMSARYALSFDIDRLGGRKNGVAPIVIATALNCLSADQIHRTLENFFQAGLHVHPFQQTAAFILFSRERAEQVHVAVAAKIVTQRRAKQFQSSNAAFVAESAQGFNVISWFHSHRAGSLS